MNRRLAYIENRRVLADSGEITLDIDVRDPVTALMFEMRSTNGTSGNVANTIAQCLTSIELIDGSEVLYSLTGMQLLALTMYQLGFSPYQLITEVPSNVQNLYGVLLFGRWFGDATYGLDPARFSNLQMRVKWNMATVRAVGVTGFVTGTTVLTVMAVVMEGAEQPPAMLIAKQHYSNTTLASGTMTIEIPNDKRIKAFLLRSAKAAEGGLAGINNIKITCDSDKFIPLDMRDSDLQRVFTTFNKPFEYKHLFYAKNGDTIYPLLKQDEQVDLTPTAGNVAAAYLNYGIGEGAVAVYTAGSAQTSAIMIAAHVHGWLPCAAAMLDMGEFDNPASWLDATLFNSIKMILTNNAADAALSLVLLQERIY